MVREERAATVGDELLRIDAIDVLGAGDGEIQEMQIRKIRDQSWVFLRFATEEARMNSWKKRWNIGEKKIYFHREKIHRRRALLS